MVYPSLDSLKSRSPLKSLSWLESEDVRPYVFVRQENRISFPGQMFELDWFSKEPVYKNPLHMDNVDFADRILDMETRLFAQSNMAMPRWVFYDCGVMPGFVAGFAARPRFLSKKVKAALGGKNPKLVKMDGVDWVPISLFIIIPTMGQGEWVAHNLSSVNALLTPEERFYGLGFLTKAFALWYANIEICCGMTQWGSPALKLHAHYGAFEVLTAYTPVHSYAQTLTYRLNVDPRYWAHFFDQKPNQEFSELYESADFQVIPRDDKSLQAFQRKIEAGQGPFFLDANQIRGQDLAQPLDVYRAKAQSGAG